MFAGTANVNFIFIFVELVNKLMNICATLRTRYLLKYYFPKYIHNKVCGGM